MLTIQKHTYFAILFITIATAQANSKKSDEYHHQFKALISENLDPKSALKYQFTQNVEIKKNWIQVKTEYAHYNQPTQKLSTEIVTYYPDGKVVYTVDQKQSQTHSKVTIKGNKVYFELKDFDGKTKTDNIDYEGIMVIKNELFPTIRKHWDKLINGEGVDFRFISPGRMSSYGFQFKKMPPSKKEDVIKIRMAPTSFFISLALDPTYFVFENKAPYRLIRIDGRTAVLVKKGSSWKNLYAKTFLAPPQGPKGWKGWKNFDLKAISR